MTERRSLPVLPSVPLDPLGFFGSLIRHLSGTLEDVVGIADAEGDADAGAALVEAQHEARPLFRSTMHEGAHAKRPAKAEKMGPVALQMIETRPPHQRAVAENPKIAHTGVSARRAGIRLR